MKNLNKSLLAICCIVLISTNLISCGQKGPLIVEQPIVVQDEITQPELVEETINQDDENKSESDDEE